MSDKMRYIVVLATLTVGLYGCQGFHGSAGGLSSTLGGPGPTPTPIPTKCDTQVTLSWVPPTTNTDGSPLTDLAGFRVYYGNALGAYPTMIDISSPSTATKIITGLAANTYYFVATAYAVRNSAVVESDYSNPSAIQLVACMNTKFDVLTGKIISVAPSISIETNENDVTEKGAPL